MESVVVESGVICMQKQTFCPVCGKVEAIKSNSKKEMYFLDRPRCRFCDTKIGNPLIIDLLRILTCLVVIFAYAMYCLNFIFTAVMVYILWEMWGFFILYFVKNRAFNNFN